MLSLAYSYVLKGVSVFSSVVANQKTHRHEPQKPRFFSIPAASAIFWSGSILSMAGGRAVFPLRLWRLRMELQKQTIKPAHMSQILEKYLQLTAFLPQWLIKECTVANRRGHVVFFNRDCVGNLLVKFLFVGGGWTGLFFPLRLWRLRMEI